MMQARRRRSAGGGSDKPAWPAPGHPARSLAARRGFVGYLITIDKTTGAGTMVGDRIPLDPSPVPDITFTSDGTLFGWSKATDDLETFVAGDRHEV